MTDLHTENARLRAALAELRRGIAMIHDALATPSRPRQSVGEVAAWWLNYADAALATPTPDAVQEAARVERLADAAKLLLSVDEYGNRKEVYAACEGKVKVYKFDAALTRLSHARTPSQETAHD